MKKEIQLSVPGSWAELSEKQLLIISKILQSPDKNEDFIQLWAFKALTGLRIIRQTGPGVYLCKIGRHKILLNSWQLNYHRKKLVWLTGTPFGVKPLRKLAGKKPVYITLEGTPLKLYIAAENYYQAFLHTEDSMFLLRLTSVLYSGGKNWDDSNTEKAVKKLKSCTPEELFTVFLWYNSVKLLLADKYHDLFSSPDTQEGSINGMPDMRSHINNMLRVLTSCDVTKMEAVLETETWYALNELNEKAHEVEEFNTKYNHG